MTTSPLQFAKDFGKLKSDLASQPAADLKLLFLIDFWPTLEQYHDNRAYRSYFDEYIPLLLHLISEENLHDLTLEELQQLLNTLRSIIGAASLGEHSGQVEKKKRQLAAVRLAAIQFAKMLFYVGSVEEGVKVCADLVGGGDSIPIDFNGLASLTECNALRVVCERFKDKSPPLYDILKSIADAWENDRLSLSHERANCLFVEKGGHHLSKPRVAAGLVPAEGDGGGQAPTLRGTESPPSFIASDRWEHGDLTPARRGIQKWRGRMRTLEGNVDLFGKSATSDEVTFENQIKAPNDPFIGVAYDSLKAVRQVFKANGFRDKAGAFYHAHFLIKNSTHTFTGDSIGLAVGLVTYTQLLKPEIMRQERFLASDVAFTGGLCPDGALIPVNKDTLCVKIERAFFSPVKYLVLPESNYEAAKQYVQKMKQRFPRRRLGLISAERLSDVIENHNVVRAEKVCMGEFVVRKAYKYTRTTKVQVPLLVGLLYLMICLLYPKAWIGFDWNPEYVRLTKKGFEALNADSVKIWSESYECDSLLRGRSAIANLTGDGRNEVLFIPGASSSCISDANLFVYNWKGTLLYQRDCTIMNEYLGDTLPDLRYDPSRLDVMIVEGEPIIVTTVVQDNPSRCHVKFWSAAGEQRGWYINAGVSRCILVRDVTGDGRQELIFDGINVRMRSAVLFVLSANSSFGVSPPYTDPEYDIHDVKPGNQLHYLLFPPSDVCKAKGCLYNIFKTVIAESDKVLRVDVWETDVKQAFISYYLDNDLRVKRVDVSDTFKSLRNALVSQGILPNIPWPEFFKSMGDSVLRWADTTWVSEKQLRKSKRSPK